MELSFRNFKMNKVLQGEALTGEVQPTRVQLGIDYHHLRPTRMSISQTKTLVGYMESNRELVIKPQKTLKGKRDQLWEELTEQLNSHRDGALKTLDAWKQVWADLKYKTKKKVRMQEDTKMVTPLEERIMHLIGFEGSADLDKDIMKINDDDADVILASHFISVGEEITFEIPSANDDIPVTNMERVEKRKLTSSPSVSSVAEDDNSNDVPTPRKRRVRQEPNHDPVASFIELERYRMQFERERDERDHEFNLARLSLDKKIERRLEEERRNRSEEIERTYLVECQRLELKRTKLKIEEERLEIEKERFKFEKERMEIDREIIKCQCVLKKVNEEKD